MKVSASLFENIPLVNLLARDFAPYYDLVYTWRVHIS